MAFWAKVIHYLTVFFMAYEAQKTLNEKNDNEKVIVHKSEITIEKTPEQKDALSDSAIILYLFIGLITIAVIVKVYKKVVKDVSTSITTN